MGYKYKIVGLHKRNDDWFTLWHEHGFFDAHRDDIKIFLRPLSDMTDEEKETEIIANPWHTTHRQKQAYREAERTLYLLSKHFDLFGLIDAGLAIDKTTISKQNADAR